MKQTIRYSENDKSIVYSSQDKPAS